MKADLGYTDHCSIAPSLTQGAIDIDGKRLGAPLQEVVGCENRRLFAEPNRTLPLPSRLVVR